MGNRSKFTFPVPGRRKHDQPQRLAVPLTKAQKILGTSGINIDSPTLPHPRPTWDTASAASGISVSVSESTRSYATNDTGLGILNEEEDGTAGTSYGRSHGAWEQESEIIPRHLHSSHGPDRRRIRPKRSAVTLGNEPMDETTDASSIRRRISTSSTIMPYYDKSKMPLSISQQTSNSAMAKGLPAKANILLDMDGTLSEAKAKKKPAKLDLSRLLPTRSRTDHSRNNGVLLGTDFLTRSPSVMSHMSGSTATPGTARRTPTKSTKSNANGSQTHLLPQRIGSDDAAKLHQLYDHYEKMSFRDIPEDDLTDPVLQPLVYEPSPPLSNSTEGRLTPHVKPVVREPPKTKNLNSSRAPSFGNGTAAPQKAAINAALSSQPRPGSSHTDCAASISSRHTQTSKATRTDRSIQDFDPQQNSVLSLSDSDSDGEPFVDSNSKSSVSSSHANKSAAADFEAFPEPPKSKPMQKPVPPERTSSRNKRTSFAPMNDFLTIPKQKVRNKNSNGTLRSVSTVNTANTVTPSMRSSSRMSFLSSSEELETARANLRMPKAQSANKQQHQQPQLSQQQQQPSYGVHEARAFAVTPIASAAEAANTTPAYTHRSQPSGGSAPYIPAANTSHSTILAADTLNRHASQHSRASDQPTPPLSPTSVDFYLRSPESIHQDAYAAGAGIEANDARFMAVTKQEEMLLAALRMKRARMRENIIAEFEGEQGKRDTIISRSSTTGHYGNGTYQEHRATTSHSDPTGRHADSRISVLGNPEKNIRSSRADRHHYQPLTAEFSSRPESQQIIDPAKEERVLLYLDRPVSRAEVIEPAEPSPNLSEFIDFDATPSDEDGPFPYKLPSERRRSSRKQRSASRSGSGSQGSRNPRPAKSSSRSPGARSSSKHSERQRNQSAQMSPKTSSVAPHLAALPEMDFDGFSDLEYFESEDGHGSARPDSPLGPLPSIPQQKPMNVGSKRSAARLSAVGAPARAGQEVGWWGDDG